MNAPGHFLNVRITHDLMSFFANAMVEVGVDMQMVGSGALQAGYFDFTWVVASMNPSVLEPFALRPERVGAIGNRYDVYSSMDGQLLATMHDQKYALFQTGISTEFSGGHFQITETTKSNLLGIINLGMAREFVLEGSAQGSIQVSDIFGNYGFQLGYSAGPSSQAQLNSILAANLILLTRSIAEHHQE